MKYITFIFIFLLNNFFILGSKEETNYNILNNINANEIEDIYRDHFEIVNTSKTFLIHKYNSNTDSVTIYTNSTYQIKINGKNMIIKQENLKLGSSLQLDVEINFMNPVIIYILYTNEEKIKLDVYDIFTFYAFYISGFQRFKFWVYLYGNEEIEIIIHSNKSIVYLDYEVDINVEQSEGRISRFNSKEIKIVAYQSIINIELDIKLFGYIKYDTFTIQFVESKNNYFPLYVAAQVLFYIGVFIFLIIILIFCCCKT